MWTHTLRDSFMVEISGLFASTFNFKLHKVTSSVSSLEVIESISTPLQ